MVGRSLRKLGLWKRSSRRSRRFGTSDHKNPPEMESQSKKQPLYEDLPEAYLALRDLCPCCQQRPVPYLSSDVCQVCFDARSGPKSLNNGCTLQTDVLREVLEKMLPLRKALKEIVDGYDLKDYCWKHANNFLPLLEGFIQYNLDFIRGWKWRCHACGRAFRLCNCPVCEEQNKDLPLTWQTACCESCWYTYYNVPSRDGWTKEMKDFSQSVVILTTDDWSLKDS